MRGRAAVRLADEAVALQPTNVPPDGHLRAAELAGQCADTDRLLLGDTSQDRVAAIRGLHGTRPRPAASRKASLDLT